MLLLFFSDGNSVEVALTPVNFFLGGAAGPVTQAPSS